MSVTWTRGRFRRSLGVLLLALALAGLVLQFSPPFSGVGDHRDETAIVTVPSVFPDVDLGVPFNFQVTVLEFEFNDDVQLSLVTACPAGGEALLSEGTLALGNACGVPLETSVQDLHKDEASWGLTVVYQGSPGTYVWTIVAHEIDDD